jgi:uncharacterized OB-fold protein
MQGEYLGMRLLVEPIDVEDLEYFRYCGRHDFHLQRCTQCNLLRYPPTTACPWCAGPDAEWTSVEGKGAVHAYGEVHHAITPQFADRLPYQLLLVDLDTQKGQPTEHEALRIVGNLVTADGALAPPELVAQIGIGSRVKLVYADVGEEMAIPQWTLDEEAPQPPQPWRYPQE